MKQDENYSEQEAAQRRDNALRRALNTPPQPRKSKPKAGEVKRREAVKKD